jgi:hypothetical protein
MSGCCQPDHLLGKVISVSKRRDVFVYTGDCVPNDVIHAIVDPSVDTIRRRAFQNCTLLESIAMHAGVKIIEHGAFRNCPSLRRVKLSGVRVIEGWAFMDCSSLEDMDFGDQIESIGNAAFIRCKSLRDIKLRTAREIGEYAFYDCIQAAFVELPGCLDRIGKFAFNNCPSLRRIATPFNMLDDNIFGLAQCDNLSRVDIVGKIQRNVSSLPLERWRNEMNEEIDRINRILPNTAAIEQWKRSVVCQMEHKQLMEGISLLELALWKRKLDDSKEEEMVEVEECLGVKPPAKKSKIDVAAARQEKRITSGASIVIKNVLPYLSLD